jgi:hypothetical protein
VVVGFTKPGAYIQEVSTFGGHSKLFIKRYGIDSSSGEFDFPAFLESFSDSYSSEWEKQSVFGRSDPMQFYGGTQRNISAEFSLVAGNVSQAQFNLEATSLMAQILYPRYYDGVISSTPLIGIKFENFICEDNDYLVGTIGNLTITPDFDNGVFGRQDYLDVNEETAISIALQEPFPDGNEIYPKIIRLSFDFTPLHRARLGWSKSSFSGDSFPYRNDLQGDITNSSGDAAFDAFDAAKEKLQDEFAEYQKMSEGFIKGKAAGGTPAELNSPNDNPNAVPAGGLTNNTAPGGPQALAGGQGQKLLLNGEEMVDNSEQKAEMKQILKDSGFPSGPPESTLSADLVSEMAFGGGLAPSDPK